MVIKILAGVSIALGGYIAVLNWYSIYASHKSERNVSAVPLLGASFLVIGLLGLEQTRPYAWVGILADYGTLIMFVAIPMLAWESWTTSRPRLCYKGRKEYAELPVLSLPPQCLNRRGKVLTLCMRALFW